MGTTQTTTATRYTIITTSVKESYHNADWQHLDDIVNAPILEDFGSAKPSMDELCKAVYNYMADAGSPFSFASIRVIGNIAEVDGWAYAWKEIEA